MKQRLIILNGYKILQNFNHNGWKTTGLIKKAEEGLKPGIYNLYMAHNPEMGNTVYEGLVLYIDKKQGIVYQQQPNKALIVHKLDSINLIPSAGKHIIFQYDDDKMVLKKTCI